MLVVEVVRLWLEAKLETELTNLLGDGVNESSVEVLLRADSCNRGHRGGGGVKITLLLTRSSLFSGF